MKVEKSQALHSWMRYWGITFALLLIMPLIAYASMGSFMRLNGDDYCYAWIVRQNGFWKAQVESYLHVSMYNGNRYSLTFFSGLVDLFDPSANGWLPALVVMMWVLGLALVLRQMIRLSHVTLGWLLTLIGAGFLCVWTLVQAPDLYQILYWRTGMLTYLAPLIANTFLFALILWQWIAKRKSWLVMILVCILALLAGGFSETGFAFQMTYLVMLSAGAVVSFRNKQPGESSPLWMCGAALLGTLLAGILLALSPTNQDRLVNLPPRPDLISLILSTVENIKIFSVITLKRLFPSTLLGFILPFGSAIIFSALQTGPNKSTLSNLMIKLGLVILLGFLLLCACFLPSAYIQSSYPGLRALIAARFVMVLIIALAGWLAGQAAVRLFERRLAHRRLIWITSLGILVLTGSLIWTVVPTILADQPKFEKWAQLWDARDSEIRTASKQNATNIHVMALDHVIPDVGELSPDPLYWYNQCAAGYYGIDSIRANQPGWDD